MAGRDVRRVVATLLLGTVATVALPAPAAAYCRLTTGMPRPGETCAESGVALRWERQCLSYSPVARLKPEPTFADVEHTIAASFDSWLEVECEGVPVQLAVTQTDERVTCNVAQHNDGAGNANAIVFVSDWEERDLPSEAFGLTLVWHDPKSGEILDADMLINETLGELTLCDVDACPDDAVDLQNVVTHEVGHFFGLGHSYSRTSSMFFEAHTGEVRKRFLNDDDAAGLCEIYAELDAAECGADRDFEPPGGLRKSCVLEDDGCAVASGGSAGSGAQGLALVIVALAATRLRRRRE